MSACAVERFKSGDMAIMPPTLISLAEMAEFRSVAEAMAASGAREVFPVEPHVVVRGEDLYLVLPGDPDYRPPVAQ